MWTTTHRRPRRMMNPDRVKKAMARDTPDMMTVRVPCRDLDPMNVRELEWWFDHHFGAWKKRMAIKHPDGSVWYERMSEYEIDYNTYRIQMWVRERRPRYEAPAQARPGTGRRGRALPDIRWVGGHIAEGLLAGLQVPVQVVSVQEDDLGIFVLERN